MLFLFSRSQTALGARAVISLAALILPLASSGCTESACFEWTEAEGTCPSQDEALIFFEDPFCGASDIKAVDSAGEFDEGACCYAVSKRDDDDYYTCDVSSGVTVGVGPSTTVGVGGAGGVGGSVGGAGGVGGAGAGGAGGSGGSSTCIRCNEAISGGDPALLCADSGELYDIYMNCVCGDVCAMVCADYCAGQAKTEECTNCESDTVGGCGNQLSACASDI